MKNIVVSNSGIEYNRLETMDGAHLCFHLDTPDDLCKLLVSLNYTRQRVLLVYGDVDTLVPWATSVPERGSIGRSSGSTKVPLLIKNAKSNGGEHILDHHVIEVRESRGARILWKRKVGV